MKPTKNQWWRAHGLCYGCGAEPTPSYVSCAACRKKYASTYTPVVKHCEWPCCEIRLGHGSRRWCAKHGNIQHRANARRRARRAAERAKMKRWGIMGA